MPIIEYVKNAPGAKRGDLRTVDAQSARVLTGLGLARLYETRVIEPAQASNQDKPGAGRSKRQYRRRDMQAK